MKSKSTKLTFPTKPDDWDTLVANAPESVVDNECPYDSNDPNAVEAYWQQAAVIKTGGLNAVRSELAKRRGRGQQKAPTKISTTLRLDADVIAAFKAQGKGWQSSINSALKQWLSEHQP